MQGVYSVGDGGESIFFSIGNVTVKQHISFLISLTLRCFESGTKAFPKDISAYRSITTKIKVEQKNLSGNSELHIQLALVISNKDISIYSRVSKCIVSTAFPIFLYFSTPDI